MEKLLATGKVRAIGVSNFTTARLDDLLGKVEVVPAVNQIEAHPYLQQPELLQYCQQRNILVEAYSPLGNNQSGEPRAVDDPVVQDLAAQVGLDAGPVLLSWGVQRGTVVLSKSVTPARIRANLQVKRLGEEVMRRLDALEKGKRFNFPARWGCDIFGEVGEDAVRRAAVEAAEENLVKFNV